MEIDNKNIEVLLIQISGNNAATMTPLGLLNFASSLKGKLRRKLQFLSTELSAGLIAINKEKERIELIEDKEEREKELADLMGEKLTIAGFERIPLSWIDEIETSSIVDIDFLLKHILFDDTKNGR